MILVPEVEITGCLKVTIFRSDPQGLLPVLMKRGSGNLPLKVPGCSLSAEHISFGGRNVGKG